MRACGPMIWRDFGAVLRGLAAFAATRLAAAFFATFVDLMDVLLAIAFTRRCLRYATLETGPRIIILLVSFRSRSSFDLSGKV